MPDHTCVTYPRRSFRNPRLISWYLISGSFRLDSNHERPAFPAAARHIYGAGTGHRRPGRAGRLSKLQSHTRSKGRETRPRGAAHRNLNVEAAAEERESKDGGGGRRVRMNPSRAKRRAFVFSSALSSHSTESMHAPTSLETVTGTLALPRAGGEAGGETGGEIGGESDAAPEVGMLLLASMRLAFDGLTPGRSRDRLSFSLKLPVPRLRFCRLILDFLVVHIMQISSHASSTVS